MSMFVGEALAGDGNEIAHIDLLIGSKDGPVGVAFANALARQSEGHTNLLAVLTPEQKARWNEMTGDPFRGQVQVEPPSGFGPMRPHHH